MMLTEKHYKCIEMLLYDKKPLCKVAEELGVHRNTIYNWMKDEEFNAAMCEARQNLKNQCQTILESHITEAYQRLWELCNCSDPRTSRSATETWINRTHGKVEQNINVETNGNKEKDYNIDDALTRLELLNFDSEDEPEQSSKTG